jgi:sporulation integral membrane protein YtvI
MGFGKLDAGRNREAEMTVQKDDKKLQFIMDCVYITAIILIVWVFFRYLLGWILPFIIGYFIAAIVQPAVRLLHKRLKLNRRVAGVLTVLMFLVVIGLILGLFITKAVSEFAAVAKLLPGLFEQLASSVAHISQNISVYVDSLPVSYSKSVATSLAGMSSELMKLSSISDGTISFLYNLLSKVPGLMLNTIVSVVSACFISMDYGEIRGFFLRQLPEKYQEWACDIKAFLFNTIAKLIRAYLILMAITFTELCVGLVLLRIPHAVAVAAAIAIVDLMPVLGTGTVIIPWAVIELLVGNFYLAFCLIAVYAIIMVVRNILEPKIVGYHLGLYPLVTLVALFVGLKVFGFSGMILFPMIIIILKHLQDTGKIRIWND